MLFEMVSVRGNILLNSIVELQKPETKYVSDIGLILKIYQIETDIIRMHVLCQITQETICLKILRRRFVD